MEKGVGGVDGEIIVFMGAVEPCVDAVEDTSNHKGSDFLAVKEISESGEASINGKTAVGATENVIPIFVETLTSSASVVMTIAAFTEFLICGPEFKHEFEGRAAMMA